MNFFSLLNGFTVAGLALLLLGGIGLWSWKRGQHRKKHGPVLATGIILSVEKIALAKEHHVEVRMLVMVMPDKSRNFVGELVETILLTDLLMMKIGDKIPVEYAGSSRLILRRT